MSEDTPSPETNEEPESPTIESYFTTNYELFAILGLFAALSVYLTQLPQEMNAEIQAGIGGSLILFVIIGFVVISKTSDCASNALNSGLFLRFSIYIMIVFCLGGLVISVVSIMNRYSQGTIPLLDYSISFGFCGSYITYLQQNEGFLSYDGETPFQNLTPYSPYIAAILLSVWQIQSGVFDQSIQTAQEEVLFGVVIGFALVHFLTTVFVGTCIVYVDRIVERVYSTVTAELPDILEFER